MTSRQVSLPRDSRLVALILSQYCDEADPTVVAMFTEFAHRKFQLRMPCVLALMLCIANKQDTRQKCYKMLKLTLNTGQRRPSMPLLQQVQMFP
jgi:hypothetical protein